jgi:hypothetical protein
VCLATFCFPFIGFMLLYLDSFDHLSFSFLFSYLLADSWKHDDRADVCIPCVFPVNLYSIDGVSRRPGRYLTCYLISLLRFLLCVARSLCCGTLFPAWFDLLLRDINCRCCYSGTHMLMHIYIYIHVSMIYPGFMLTNY